jgi:hypothetical protein
MHWCAGYVNAPLLLVHPQYRTSPQTARTGECAWTRRVISGWWPMYCTAAGNRLSFPHLAGIPVLRARFKLQPPVFRRIRRFKGGGRKMAIGRLVVSIG